jgi:hypothetical protein
MSFLQLTCNVMCVHQSLPCLRLPFTQDHNFGVKSIRPPLQDQSTTKKAPSRSANPSMENQPGGAIYTKAGYIIPCNFPHILLERLSKSICKLIMTGMTLC